MEQDKLRTIALWFVFIGGILIGYAIGGQQWINY